MSIEYWIHLPDGNRDGPFTEEELLDMVDADELGAGAVCEHTETGHCCRVRDLFKVIPPAEPPSVSEEPISTIPQSPNPARWVPAPFPEKLPLGKDSAQRPVRPVTIYCGHPSFWMYWRSALGSLLLMAGGWYAGRWEDGGWWLAAGWLAGGLWLAITLLKRSSIDYRITTRRVEVEQGFFSKSSWEVQIDDIRAINVKKSGLIGLLGVGDLIFSSSGGTEEDVVFRQTPGAHRLKGRVRRLQDQGK